MLSVEWPSVKDVRVSGLVSWAVSKERFNVPHNTLYVILEMVFTGQMTQPTMSKLVGCQDALGRMQPKVSRGGAVICSVALSADFKISAKLIELYICRECRG